LGIRHQVAGRHGGQVHCGGDLGRGLLEPVDFRIAALVLGPLGRGYSMPQQCRHCCQPLGHQRRLLPVRGLDHRHQGSRIQITDRDRIRHCIEHTFDYRCVD
jgi:hypothetical protein